MDNNILVFSILGIAFIAVAVHLILYTLRKSRHLRRFAEKRGLTYHPRDAQDLESDVNDTFDLQENGLVQNFSRVRDVIRFDSGILFRTVELLDLNPYGSASNPHSARVAVMFDMPESPEGIFTISPSMEVQQRYPLEGTDATDRITGILQSAEVHPPPHSLTISLKNGRALAYLEPLVIGSVSDTDLDYLIGLPGQLQMAA